MKPTLFICIGGSGMKIGHAIKYNFHTYMPDLLLTPDGAKGEVKFLFIENDVTELDDIKKYYRYKQGIFDRDEFVPVGKVNAERVVSRIERNLNDKIELEQPYNDINLWVDKSLNFPDTVFEIGLAACRQAGRIGLAVNYNEINLKITEAFEKLANIANKRREAKADGTLKPSAISVYIITGICGGTGSSMFLDISAMLDNLPAIVETVKKKAVFINTNYYLSRKLIDPNITVTHSQYINLQINSVAMISECEFFYKKFDANDKTLLGKYTARNSEFINNVSTGRSYTPFTNAYVFDTITDNRKKIPLDKFFFVVSDMLYYSLVSMVNTTFEQANEANATIEGKGFGFQSTVGYNSLAQRAIIYPSEEFLDYFQKRYIYDVFSNTLLNKDLKGFELRKKSEDFINDVFGEENSLFAGLASNYRSYLTHYLNRNSLTSDDQYYNNDGKLIDKDDIIKQIEGHLIALDSIKKELEEKRKSMPDLGFKTKTSNWKTFADQMRNALVNHSLKVITSQGFYGVLGINEGNNINKGLLGETADILRQMYKELTAFKTTFNESDLVDKLNEEKVKLINKLTRKFRLNLTFDKIKDEIDDYHKAIKNYIDQLYNFNICQIKQEILYYFAVGESKFDIADSFYGLPLEKNSTEINKYRDGLSIAVGITQSLSGSKDSIISVFDKGPNDDSETISNNFLRFLPQKWLSTKEDLFTVYVPENLYDYIGNDSQWKPGTVIDRVYKTNITINQKEIEDIFGNDPLTDTLLAKIGIDLEKINQNISLIRQKIESGFLGKYITNSTHPIATFINKTINDVYNEGSVETQSIIRGEKHNLAYPVCDPENPKTPVPYLTINPELGNFALTQLRFDPNRIAENKGMAKNQIVFIGIVQGVKFHNLAGNEANLQIYKDRNLLQYRPHLHYEWNNYTYGPYDTLREVKVYSDDNIKYELTDALPMSYFFEKLIEKSPDVGKVIFVIKDNTLINKNGKRSTPVTFNPLSQIFSYYSEGEIVDEILEEAETGKFYVKEDRKNPGGIRLGKLFETMEFEEANKKLANDPHFIECFEKFLKIVKEHKAEITNLIDDEVNKLVSHEIIKTKQRLDKYLTRYSKNISMSNQVFINNFSEEIKRLVNNMFNITLDY